VWSPCRGPGRTRSGRAACRILWPAGRS
jgi:hypothetical protein